MRMILFYGELPLSSIHGISTANQINLKILGSVFIIDKIEESSRLDEHDRITINKILQFIRNNLKIMFKSVSRRYDYFYLVFSLSAFGSFKSLVAIISFRLFNRGKVVLHIHRGDFFTRFYKTLINKFITKLTFSLSDKIIVLSENQKTEFDAFFKRPFCVLRNTVEIEDGPNQVSRNNVNFIYISNYILDKGIIDLLEVFTKVAQEHEKITLKAFGEFTDKNLADAIMKYNSEHVSINGPISGIVKFEEIRHADCLILPSWTEGQPVVLLEAMSVGTPVIATGVGLIPELLGDNYPYLTVPRDNKSLEKKIIQFIYQGDTKLISEKFINQYKNLYSQKKHSEDLLSIFC